MIYTRAFRFNILFTFTMAVLTACGGSSGVSSSTGHPEFNRAKVSVSSFYQPTGIIHDSSPTFSWLAIPTATHYRLGFEDTETQQNWQEYVIVDEPNTCNTITHKCSFTPNDLQLLNGDEKVWWVQAKIAGQWNDWSKAFVFKYVDDSNTHTEASPIAPVGVITTTHPTFIWSVANGADRYQFGLESVAENDWQLYDVTTAQANCQASQCSFTPANPQLIHNDKRTWWVRSHKNGIWSNWSNGSQFSIDASSSNERPLILKIDSHVSTCQMPTGCHSEEKFTIMAGSVNTEQYDYNVDCDSDGINEATHQIYSYTCQYNARGEYRVTISGLFPHIITKRVTEIEQWGTQRWSSMASSFTFARNLKISAVDKPDLSQVTSANKMFFRGSFDPDLSNQNVSHWDVSNITDMSEMFREAHKFNADISNWDVSNVNTMDLMFYAAESFNQDIGNWDVSKVTNMLGMFMSATSFNQDISNWNTSNVTEIKDMFNHATSFNQPIGNWDVSKITRMERLFSGATAFNQDISSWDVSNVTDMSSMFSHARAFNKSLANWDVSKVINMSYMFSYATLFNQDISNWDVSKVKVINAVDKGMDKLLFNTSFSTQNYDKLLTAWSNLQLSNNISFSVGDTKYSASSSAARQQIIDNFSWHFEDGGEL